MTDTAKELADRGKVYSACGDDVGDLMQLAAAELRELRRGIAATMNILTFCPWCTTDTEDDPEPHDHDSDCFLRAALDSAQQGEGTQ